MKKVFKTYSFTVNNKEILLSERELGIIKLICQDLPTAEISKQLFITPHTISWHRKRILQKLGTKSVIGMMRFAIDNKIIQL